MATVHGDAIVIYYLKALEVETLAVAAANCDIRQQIVLLKMHTRRAEPNTESTANKASFLCCVNESLRLNGRVCPLCL